MREWERIRVRKGTGIKGDERRLKEEGCRNTRGREGAGGRGWRQTSSWGQEVEVDGREGVMYVVYCVEDKIDWGICGGGVTDDRRVEYVYLTC